MTHLYFYDFPIGRLGIAETAEKISHVSYGLKLPAQYEKAETPLIRQTAQQLTEYFNGERQEFSVPLCAQGTPFQQSVWKSLTQIPYGKTVSYQDIARAAGNPNACRAAGLANNRNPIAILIPCHRVIGKSGCLTGYAGGLDKKHFLLDLEKSF